MSSQPLIDVRPDHWDIVRDILRKHVPQCEVWAFGSRAKWVAKPYSDLDLAVISDEPLPIQVSAELAEDFAESDLPWRVDVVDWATTSESFRQIIERDKVVVQKREEGAGSSRVGTGRTGGREATSGVIPGRYALSVGCPDIKPPDGWRWTPLSSVAQLESGHTPGRKHPEYWDGDIPWIGIKDATENHGRTILDTYQHVTKLGLENSSARLLPANTVCLSRTASVGFVVVMGRPMATSQDFVNWVCGPNIDPHYLKYVLLAENEALWRFASGTTHQTIYYPEAKAFCVCLPPFGEQKSIVNVLLTIDEKIETNRKISRSLEAITRALFKSWFVDFDPVRALVEGRNPDDIDESDVRLFPRSFQNSSAGMVPEGWGIGPLGAVGINSRRAVKPNQIEMGTPYIALEHMPRRSIALCEWDESADVASGKSSFKRGDILFGKLRPYFHKVGVAPVDGICSTDILVIEPKSAEWFGFLLGWLSSDAVVNFADIASTGTKMPRTSWKDLGSFEVALPPGEVAGAFTKIVRPLVDQIVECQHQSRFLSKLRDALIPRLLSGELRLN